MEIQLCLIVFCFVIFCYYSKNAFSYWSRRGVIGPKPWPIVGNYGPVIFGKLSEADLLFKMYHQYPNEKCVGFYKGMTPVLLLRDPALVKLTLEKNIATFFRRTAEFEDIFEQHLGGKNYESWQIKRRNLSTLFSNTNLENIMPLLKDCIERHQADIDEMVNKKYEIDIKAKVKEFFLESVYVMCLGIGFNVCSKGSPLEKLIEKSIPLPKYSKFNTIITTFSSLVWLIKPILRTYMKNCNKLVRNIMKETKIMDQNFDTFTGRVVHLKGKIESIMSSREMDEKFNEDFIVQNVSLMILSVETLAKSITSAILELARDQEAQEKAYKEIIRVLENNDEELSVKAIFDMTYLLEIQEEAVRCITRDLIIFRSCESEFELEDLNFSIDKRAKICVQTSTILMDPKHFDEPGLFKPERYSTNYIQKMKHDGTDLTFSFGPRMCFARRFSKFMGAIVLIMYLQRCKFQSSPLTKHRLDLNEDDYKEPKHYKVPKRAPTECWVKIQPREACVQKQSLH